MSMLLFTFQSHKSDRYYTRSTYLREKGDAEKLEIGVKKDLVPKLTSVVRICSFLIRANLLCTCEFQ